MPPWARASELERALECPASCVLPREDRGPGEAALWGTQVHHWKATGESFPGLEDRGRNRARLTRLEVLAKANLTRGVLWPGGTHEVTYVVHADGSVDRHLGDVDRELLPREDTAGTADWELDAPILWVDDLKTGRHPQDAPDDRPQTLWYGAAAAVYHDAPAALLSITHWPRYPRDEPPTRVTRLVSRDRLTRFLRDVADARERALSPDAASLTRQGPWCTYCPCRSHCPEFVNE